MTREERKPQRNCKSSSPSPISLLPNFSLALPLKTSWRCSLCEEEEAVQTMDWCVWFSSQESKTKQPPFSVRLRLSFYASALSNPPPLRFSSLSFHKAQCFVVKNALHSKFKVDPRDVVDGASWTWLLRDNKRGYEYNDS